MAPPPVLGGLEAAVNVTVPFMGGPSLGLVFSNLSPQSVSVRGLLGHPGTYMLTSVEPDVFHLHTSILGPSSFSSIPGQPCKSREESPQSPDPWGERPIVLPPTPGEASCKSEEQRDEPDGKYFLFPNLPNPPGKSCHPLLKEGAAPRQILGGAVVRSTFAKSPT